MGPVTPGPRGRQQKKRRTGIVFPAIGIAAFVVAAVYFVTTTMSSSGNGASGLAQALGSLPHSNSIQLLEAERQNLIVMNAAVSTLSQGAKPVTVNPQQVMASMQASSSTSSGSSSSSSSSDTTPVQIPSPGTAQSIAYHMLPSFGFNQTTEFSCLVKLWTQESSWQVDAENASGAYGIPQALPGYQMASVGSDWRTNAVTQIKWGLGYITSRYGTPCGAEDHELSAGWY